MVITDGQSVKNLTNSSFIFSHMKKLLFLLAALPFCVAAQTEEDAAFIRKLADEVLVNGKAHDLLRDLTKNIGHRLSGSPQYNKAAVWGKTEMEKMGADKAWLQECLVPNWKRGGEEVFIAEMDGRKQKRKLNALGLGNSLGSGKPVVAKVLAVQDFKDLEKRKDEVKGKIVYYNAAFDQRHVQTFRAYGEMGQYRRSGASRAAKYGAVGTLIRSLGGGTDNFAHTGSMAYNDSLPKIPAAALGLRDADFLWDMTRHTDVTVSLTTSGKFNSDTINHNVIAELRGSQFPDTYITIGGHLDSWDVGEGAHDDGAGIVQTMEVLRAFKQLGYQPRYSIRFVLFANEENGLRGGQKYAEEAKAKGEKHLFALESDAGGFTPRGFGFTASPEQLAKIKAWLPLLKPYGIGDLEAGGGGADIGPLRSLGTVLAGLQPDSQRYFDVHHTHNDVFENVNKRELHLGALNMAALIYLVDKYGL